ncbi:MAG: TolC family protein [Oligoflexia bacterium]|nr:TolC family protein [Oligoflexia bacterium]
MFVRYLAIFVLLMTSTYYYIGTANSKILTYEQLVQEALIHSPILKPSDARSNIMEKSIKLNDSYYFPTFEIKQKYLATSHPVNAFGMKLTKKELMASDFQNIDKLNRPDAENIHQTTLSIYIPIDISGSIGANKKVIENQNGATELEKKWLEIEIRKNLYALYYTNFNLVQLEDFLKRERKFLEGVAKSYDIKNSENKNRYLTYNHARIILEDIADGINSTRVERNKILESVRYICGVASVELSNVLPKDYNYSRHDEKENTTLNRYDLLSMKKMMDVASTSIIKEEKKYWPSLGVFAEYNITTGKFDHYANDGTIGVGLTWNFGLSIPASVSYFKANFMLSKTDYENKEMSVLSEIKKLKDELEQLEYKIGSMEKRHQLFEENKKILNYQYRRGSVDLYNMLDNFTHYLQNYSELQSKKSEYRSKLISYIMNFKQGVK